MGFFQSLLNLFSGETGKKMNKTLTCPTCPGQMLTAKEKLGVKIYLCTHCGGSFLTQECLNNFLNFHEGDDWPELFDLQADSGHTFERSPTSRKCPGCDDKMDNVEFQYVSGIWVDYCPNGHGAWLDSGELKLIKDYKKQMESPMSSEEKNQMFMSMLTGGAEAGKNINRINREVNAEYASRHRHPNEHGYGRHTPVDRELMREKAKERIEKRKEENENEKAHLEYKKEEAEYIETILSPHKLEEYKQRAEEQWKEDSKQWDSYYPMTEGYLKDKIKKYALEDGFIEYS